MLLSKPAPKSSHVFRRQLGQEKASPVNPEQNASGYNEAGRRDVPEIINCNITVATTNTFSDFATLRRTLSS